MIQAIETNDLGKRYGDYWALQHCTLEIPIGRIVGLVGPNGAGKTTLLLLAMGLLNPSVGSIQILGWSAQKDALKVLPRVGFVAQERPLYRNFTVKEMLTLGRKLNPRWDDNLAGRHLEKLGIPLNQPTGKLSDGQQAQVGLAIALAKRPEVLLLDEPVASLDPLARREFGRTLMEAVAENGLTVLFSSHLIADLDRICDYLVVLSASRVQIANDIDQLLKRHKLLSGPRGRAGSIARTHTVLNANHAERQSTLLVRTNGTILDPAWDVRDVNLEDVVLAYLAQPALPVPEQSCAKEEISL